MPTPISGAAAYATPDDFLAAYDSRLIGQLVLDNNATASPADLLTNTVVAAALAQASGLVESACLAAGRYAAADLAALAGNGDAMLVRLVCDVAMWLLQTRRDPRTEETTAYRSAKELLERLRQGEHIFPLSAQADAGVAVTARVTVVQLAERNGAVWQAQRWLGVRSYQNQPFYPGGQ